MAHQFKTRPTAVDRRRFLRHTWSGVTASLSLALLSGRGLFAAPSFGDNPFTLGVASGDPTRGRHRVVDPAGARADDRLLGSHAIPVRWRVATDPACARKSSAARRGGRPSWRTRCTSRSTASSRGGTTSTSSTCAARRARWDTSAPRPAPTSWCGELRFAFVTCQDWPSGYYTAYRDMLQNDLDLVLHLGDYTYEYAIGNTRVAPGAGRLRAGDRRSAHLPPAARAVQARRRSAGRAREVPVRSSSGTTTRSQTTTRAWRRSTARRRRSSPRGARRPIRRITSTCRSARRPRDPRRACASTGGCLRQAGRVHDARRPAVSHRQPVWRRRTVPLRRRPSRVTTPCSGAAGALGRPRLRAIDGAMEHRRAAAPSRRAGARHDCRAVTGTTLGTVIRSPASAC